MTMQKDMMGRAVRDSFAKLDPRVQIQNPVMFLVWLSAVMTSVLAVASIFGVQDAGVPAYYVVAIAVILWLTDLFSNFAEALAEGRGKAQADSLRAAKKDVEAHRIESVEDKEHFTVVPGTELTRGDLVIVRAGEQIPGDGDVIEGAASVDESAITGESAPVVREAGGDRSAVTGGTTVLSDWIIVKISSEPGQSFLDKMIAMVEGAKRKKTPNEVALTILLAGMVCAALWLLYPRQDLERRLATAQDDSALSTTYLNNLLRSDPDNPQLRLLLAQRQAAQGEVEQVRKTLQPATASNNQRNMNILRYKPNHF